MNIIFFGTSEFAVPALDALVAAGLAPAAVVTLPDRPQGRGLELLPSPVKISAEKHGIPVWQPEKPSDAEFLKKLSETSWNVGVVAAYGKLIPQAIIDLPAKGVLNIHPSLLPELRGPSPIQYAILEGKETTGVSVMLIDKEMDHGPILLQEELRVDFDDTYETLERRLAAHGADLLVQAIPELLSGSLTPHEQDHTRATFSKKIEKEDGHIHWNDSATAIARKIRAFQPWPGTFTFWNHSERPLRLKIIEALPEASVSTHQPGLVEEVDGAMIIGCSDGFLRIQKIQPEGKKTQSPEEFLNGHKAVIGAILT